MENNQKKRVLIVEDDSTSRILLERYLAEYPGLELKSVGDGLAAIEEVSKEVPALVFMDLIMPRLDGFETCEILKSVPRWKNIPVVFTSSLAGEDQVRRGLEVGAHSYLKKPLSLKNLLETLDHVFAVGTEESASQKDESFQILNEIINSAKQAFNIMTGDLTSFDGYSNVPAEYASKTWDYAGTISTEGAATITVSSGLSAEQLGLLGASMLGDEVADEDLLMGCQQELLNVILGGPVGVISKTRPVKLGLPVLRKNCGIQIDETAKDAFLIEFRSEHLRLELVLTLSFGNDGEPVR